MRKRMRFAIFLCLLVGCSDPPVGVDAAIDAGRHDAGGVPFDAGRALDAGDDAGTIDAGQDAGMDAGLDAGAIDGGSDGGMNAGMDSGADAGAVDAGFDASLDAGPLGTCSAPQPIMWTNDTYEETGVLSGAGSNDVDCSVFPADGPDRVLSFDVAAPTYVWAAHGGDTSFDPVLALHAGSCAGMRLTCDGELQYTIGIGGDAPLAPGSYVVVADSSAISSGDYGLVVSRSTVRGDRCGDIRPLVLDGSRTIVAGSTRGLRADFDASCDSGTMLKIDQLFELVAPRSGRLTLRMTTDFDSQDQTLSVRTGATCATSTQVPGGCASSVTRPGLTETLAIDVTAGTTYYVRVGGYTSGYESHFSLEATLP